MALNITREVVEATKLKAQKHLQQLKEERVTLERDSARWSKEIREAIRRKSQI